jgi:hypothetical protein
MDNIHKPEDTPVQKENVTSDDEQGLGQLEDRSSYFTGHLFLGTLLAFGLSMFGVRLTLAFNAPSRSLN